MKLKNVLKLEERCRHYDDSYCFTEDHDSLKGLTCQNCIHGNELVEQLLEKTDNFREARDLYFTQRTELLEACKEAVEMITIEYCSHPDECGANNSKCYAQKLYKAIAKAEEA